MERNSKIFIAGRYGLVGSAIERCLRAKGYENIIGKRHGELDLTSQFNTERFIGSEQPEYVFLCSAKVGGILSNFTYPAEFIFSNLQIQNNIIDSSLAYKVKKMLFMGSSCIYPRNCKQPIKEEYLLSGPLEETNRAYAVAKIAGIEMCRSYNRQYGTQYIPVMPTNLFGPNDTYDSFNSHVIPGLMMKFAKAKKENEKSVTLWGSGSPLREFLHSDDLAEACILIMEKYSFGGTGQDQDHIINIGSGEEVSIFGLAGMIKKIMGYHGEILWDTSKPDGTPRKLLDSSFIRSLGWTPKFSMEEGLKTVIEAMEKQWSLDKFIN